MKVTYNAIINFVKPYYENKDIMHNMWHIELVKKKIDQIISISNYDINYENNDIRFIEKNKMLCIRLIADIIK